jgi:hypothetical protein
MAGLSCGTGKAQLETNLAFAAFWREQAGLAWRAQLTIDYK